MTTTEKGNAVTGGVTARELAKNHPVIDLLADFSVYELLENRPFSNLSEILLGGKSPVRGLMRACGADELFVSREGSDYEKFSALCACAPRLVGHPLYRAISALLDELFDCKLPLTPQYCDEIWRLTAKRLQERPLVPVDLLRSAMVDTLCFPEEPNASLAPYRAPCENSFFADIRPVFAPVMALSLKKGIKGRMQELSLASGVSVTDYHSLCRALTACLDRFEAHRCVTAYHTLPPERGFSVPNEYQAGEILAHALVKDGKGISDDEANLFYAQMLRFLGKEYRRRGITLLLMLGGELQCGAEPALRLGGCPNILSIGRLLSYLDESGTLPRTLLLTQKPSDFDAVAALIAAFPAKSEGEPLLRLGGCPEALLDAREAQRRLDDLSRVAPIGEYAMLHSGAWSPLVYFFAPRVGEAACDWLVREGGLDADRFAPVAEDILYKNSKKLLGR